MPSHHRIIHITPHTPTIPTTAIDDDLFRHNWIDAAICTVYIYRYCCSHNISASAETCNSRKCCSALDMYMICSARAKRLTRYRKGFMNPGTENSLSASIPQCMGKVYQIRNNHIKVKGLLYKHSTAWGFALGRGRVLLAKK